MYYGNGFTFKKMESQKGIGWKICSKYPVKSEQELHVQSSAGDEME